MSRKVCVVTGSRAEFGLLRWLMREIVETDGLDLQVIATGMHLSPGFGDTYREIEEAGFSIDERVEMLLSAASRSSVIKSMGLGLVGFADALTRLAPDIVLVLGDRFEIFAAASAALIARIPVAHLHGGEITQGAFDDSMRHAITKLAHLHFVAAEEYRNRVIQMGESPDRVFNVGGLGVDAIKRVQLLERDELERDLGLSLEPPVFLVTFHPATLSVDGESLAQLNELLDALGELKEARILITMPNADSEGAVMCGRIAEFVSEHPNSRCYSSLGQLRYLSLLRQVDAVVGNSSSGLTEAPSFGVPTINIGDRQDGRLQASSVINCEPRSGAILEAVSLALSREFRQRLSGIVNPYGDGGSASQIVKVLRDYNLDGIHKKLFFDIPLMGTRGQT